LPPPAAWVACGVGTALEVFFGAGEAAGEAAGEVAAAGLCSGAAFFRCFFAGLVAADGGGLGVAC